MACLSYGPKARKGLVEHFFCTAVGHVILILHAFIGETQQTPRRDLELARRRLREVRRDTHNDMIAAWKKDSTFRKEYDALEETFALFDALLKARSDAGLTQAEVAERMGTKTSAVARLEAGGGRRETLPLPRDVAEIRCCRGLPCRDQPRPCVAIPSVGAPEVR